ncbi:MAG: VCBS repeat-containing protein, partial [Bacteroidetes bacterium]|nr:VCBS repeat-containing protein [Bacteroidota bacterium]
MASLFALLFSVLQGWLLAQNFYNIAATQGLNFTALSTDNWGSGISFYDFDQDGWDDLCFAKENGIQEIYRNDAGNLVHPNFSISNFGQTKHLLWVDYNNDDYLDIFLTTKFGTIHLLENDGSFNFTEKTVQAGLASIAAANYGASFADYDRDGDLDLYLCKYSFTGDSLNLRDVNNLYRNNGDGTFTDQTFASGTSNGVKASFQSVWFDYDLDGWPDLFVINDRFAYPNALYHNNGDGSFSDISNSANLALQLNNPMTASVADFENDGDLDIFISNTSIPNVNDLPLLMLNQGNGFFEDKANSYNLIMNNTTWGGLWLDYDNNGLQDLYVATAFLDYSLAPQNSYFFRNNFPLTFQEDSSLFIGNH